MKPIRLTPDPHFREVAPPFAAILIITALLALTLALRSPAPPQVEAVPLTVVSAADAGDLEDIFAEHDYRWPPAGPVPHLELQQMPPDMGELEVERKKQLFFRSVLPLILAENRRVRRQREFVEEALAHYASLGAAQRRQLQDIAGEYKVEGDLSRPAVRHRLLRRVDIVPPALALAQAANESAWGDSRFTVEGNSLFGIWTWQEEKGAVPQERKAGAKHLVHVYPDLRASVRDYMHNLNSGHAYRLFRLKRRAMRTNDEPLNAMQLAGTLLRYSERGYDYVAELRQIMLGNGLTRLGPLRLEG